MHHICKRAYAYSCFFALFITFVDQLIAQPSCQSLQHLTTNEGLAHNRVKPILQDQRGFIWLGTGNGLSRYDGYQFKNYQTTPFDSCSLKGNAIIDIAEGAQGILWVGSFDGGLHKFDPIAECFEHIPIPHITQPQDGAIYALHVDRQGIVWLITEHLIIKRYDPKTKQLTSYGKKQMFRYVFNTLEDPSGRYLFFDVWNTNVRVFDTQLCKFVSPPNAHLLARPMGFTQQILAQGKQGEFWVYRSNAKQLQQIELKTGKVSQFRLPSLPSTPIRDSSKLSPFRPTTMFQDLKGLIWLSTQEGFIAFDPTQKQFSKKMKVTGRKKKITRINSVFSDKSNKTWLSTENGVYLGDFHANPTTLFTTPTLAAMTEAVYQDKEGIVWVGGEWSFDAFLPNGTHLENFNQAFKAQFPKADVRPGTFSPDPKGRQHLLWLSSWDLGLLKLNKHTKRFTQYLPKDTSNRLNNVYDILPDQNNVLWLACNNGLQKFDTDTHTFTWYQYNPPNLLKIAHDGVQTIYKDKQGLLWLGTFESGAISFDPVTGKFTAYQHSVSQKNSLSNNNVTAFHEDSKGRFWVATNGGGFSLLDRNQGTFTHYTQKRGLPNNQVFGVLEDSHSNLWISTSHGISRFNPDNQTFTHYDQRDGLLHNELNERGFFKNQEGRMFFGGTMGVTAFDANQLTQHTYHPPLVITRFKKFNQTMSLHDALSPNGTLVLSYHDLVVSFEVAALGFYNSYKHKYAYKLEGLHEDWIYLENRREISLTALASGTYTLRIKATNHEGVWNNKGIQLSIKVVPPFWRTWWFNGLVAFVIVGTIILIYSWRLQQSKKQRLQLEHLVDNRTAELKKLNQTKDRFFAIIAHDLRGPLTSFREIGNLISHYLRKNQPEKIEQLGKRIDISAKKLNTLLNNLLNWALVQQQTIAYNPEPIALQKLAKECLDAYQGSLQSHQIQVTIDIANDLEIWADVPSVTSILQNLLSNAIKFTPVKGHISVEAYNQQTQVVVAIKDSGIGMTAEAMDKVFDITHKKSQNGLRGEMGSGLGLVLCQAFAKLNKASIHIKSTLNEGSTFFVVFEVPVNAQTPQNEQSKVLAH